MKSLRSFIYKIQVKTSKIFEDCKMLNLKNTFIAEKLSLIDYLYALASNIEWT